jgi:hypothetical protein
MEVDCEIVGATIVTPQGRFRGTISVDEGRIAGLLAKPSGILSRDIG